MCSLDIVGMKDALQIRPEPFETKRVHKDAPPRATLGKGCCCGAVAKQVKRGTQLREKRFKKMGNSKRTLDLVAKQSGPDQLFRNWDQF